MFGVRPHAQYKGSMNDYSALGAYGIEESDQGYYRHPTIFGDRVVFVSEDDLWEVPLTGGYARRLTGSAGAAVHPYFSPDGSRIAFTSNEEGAPEVYVMDSRGGPAKKLTFNGAQSTVTGWSKDGTKVLFRSNFREPFARSFAIYQVSAEGGETEKVHVGPAHHLTFEPEGPGRVLARNGDDLARWKRYKGGTAPVLWIDVDGDGHWRRLLPEIVSGLCRPMWLKGRIFFVSDYEGYGNLYSCLPTGEDLKRHTDHVEFYVRFASTDGEHIVYSCGAELYRFDVDANRAEKIDVAYASPRIQLKRKYVEAEEYVDDFALHPKGHSLVVASRGKPFNFGNWEGAVRQTGIEQGVRYRLARYLNDGERIIVLSDASGEEKLEIHRADGSKRPKVVDVGAVDLGRAVELEVSPVADAVAFSNHRHELIHVDLKTGVARVLDRSPYQRIAGVSWSADGRWIAYGFYDDFSTSVIKIAEVETGECRAVTTGEFQDFSPVFDPKGRYLYFLSYRHFDPVYDQMFFELSFPRGMKPCVLTLRADEDSPFLEKPRPLDGDDDDDDGDGDEESSEESSEEAVEESAEDASSPVEEAGENKDAKNGKKDEGPDPIEIDFDGIEYRVQVFPVQDANYGELGATAERIFWTVYPVEGALGRAQTEDEVGGALKYFSLKSLKEKIFARNVASFVVGPDLKTMALWTDSGLQVVSAAGEGPHLGEGGDDDRPSRQSGFIDFGRLSLAIEPRAEWCQMLRESWRLMRDHFWREDMGGVDWPEVWERYKRLLGRVSARSEFSDLVWVMQGELGTSHAYEMGGDYPVPPQYRPGFLGAEVVWDADWASQVEPEQGQEADEPDEPERGAYRIVRLIRGDRWSNVESSPLSRPGVHVTEGDVIVAINGQRVSAHVSVEQRLVNQANKEVEVVVCDGEGKNWRVYTVKTLAFETPLRYREWVLQNRRRVHQATSGRIGYVHIPDMGPEGYSEFHRHFLSEKNRVGLIVDVRYNGGGHVSQLILEKLARKPLGYDIQRWGKAMPYPTDAIPGPLVALTNEHAGSDGDIFSHCFKLMKLGPLLGKRTWGGVVGIWPRHGLVDGSCTTQPEFSFWFSDVGFGVENYGTDPDIVVEYPPQADAMDADPQLDAAIAKALEMLEANTPELPEFAPYPDLRAPRAWRP
jgi:tricorn protease